MSLAHIRVVSDSLMGQNTHVYFVDEEGIETEITHAFTRVDLRVGRMNRLQYARMTAYVGSFDVKAIPRRWWWLKRRLRNWTVRRAHETTSFGATCKTYLPGGDRRK